MTLFDSSMSLLPGAGIAALVLTMVWMLIRSLRDRDAFERASDSRLPSDDRVRAIAVLSKSATQFPRGWRRRQVPTLLSDLRTYDRCPVVREAAAAALVLLPLDRSRPRSAGDRPSNLSSRAAPPLASNTRHRPTEF